MEREREGGMKEAEGGSPKHNRRMRRRREKNIFDFVLDELKVE